MSQQDITQELLADDGLADDELDNDDYCFIFDRDGNVKSVILPEVVPFTAPKNIAKILKILGVRDIAMLDTAQEQTLH
jgi:hypothetical protein